MILQDGDGSGDVMQVSELILHMEFLNSTHSFTLLRLLREMKGKGNGSGSGGCIENNVNKLVIRNFHSSGVHSL